MHKRELHAHRRAVQFHLVFVLQWSGLKFIIVVAFKRNREARTGSIIGALYEGEGELSLDDAFLYAAQQFGLEINLQQHKPGTKFNTELKFKIPLHVWLN